MERARMLDYYATLSGKEMIQRTDEIHDLIGDLNSLIASDAIHIDRNVARQIIERIHAYHQAENAEMVAFQNTNTSKQ